MRLLPLDWPVLVLLAAALLSLFTAQNFGVAAHEFHAVVLTGVLAYGLVRLSPATPQERQFDPWPVVWGLGLGAAAVAGWGIFQAATGAQLIAAEGVLRGAARTARPTTWRCTWIMSCQSCWLLHCSPTSATGGLRPAACL